MLRILCSNNALLLLYKCRSLPNISWKLSLKRIFIRNEFHENFTMFSTNGDNRGRFTWLASFGHDELVHLRVGAAGHGELRAAMHEARACIHVKVDGQTSSVSRADVETFLQRPEIQPRRVDRLGRNHAVERVGVGVQTPPRPAHVTYCRHTTATVSRCTL